MPYVCVPEGVWDILFKIVLTIIRYFHPKIHTSNKRVHEPFFKAKTNHTPTPFTKRKAAKNKIKTETLCFSESFLENNLYIYINPIWISEPTKSLPHQPSSFTLNHSIKGYGGSHWRMAWITWRAAVCRLRFGSWWLLVASSWVGWLVPVGWLVRCDKGKESVEIDRRWHDLFWSSLRVGGCFVVMCCAPCSPTRFTMCLSISHLSFPSTWHYHFFKNENTLLFSPTMRIPFKLDHPWMLFHPNQRDFRKTFRLLAVNAWVLHVQGTTTWMPTTTPPPFQSAAFLLSGAKPPEGEFLEGELGEGEFLLSHGSVMKVVLVYILYIYIYRERVY